MDVQKLLRNDLALLCDRLDHIGMLGEVLDGLFGDITGKLNGKDLVYILDHDRGTTDDNVEIRDRFFDAIDPLDVNIFMYGASLQSCRNVGGRDQHLRVRQRGVFLRQSSHRREHFSSELFVIIIQRKVLLF